MDRINPKSNSGSQAGSQTGAGRGVRGKGNADMPLSYDNQSTDKVVDIAMARMKAGVVVEEDRTNKTKKSLIVAACIVVFGLLIVFGSNNKQPETVIADNGDVTIRLNQDANGHYFALGKINGSTVSFLVDTGATNLAIPAHIAEDLDLKLGRKSQSYTANGLAASYQTLLESVTLGGLVLNNIDASVSPGLIGDEILLGMSFLKHLNLEQRDGVLTISNH